MKVRVVPRFVVVKVNRAPELLARILRIFIYERVVTQQVKIDAALRAQPLRVAGASSIKSALNVLPMMS